MENDLLLTYGDEPFLVDRALSLWRQDHEAPDAEIEVVDGQSKLAPLKQSLMDLPLFAAKRAVILRDPPQLSGRAKKGANSAAELADLVSTRHPDVALCIAFRGAVPAANPVITAIKKAGGKVTECKRIKGRDLRAWMEREVKEQQVALPRGGLEHLLAVSNGELGTIAQELQKLRFYSDGKPISLADLKILCSGQEGVEVWAVMDRLFGESPASGAAALDSLIAAGRAAQYLLITLAAQVRDLITTGALLQRGTSSEQIAAKLGMPGWRSDRLLRQARQVPVATTRKWLGELHQLDAKGKKGEVDDVEGLRIFIRRAAVDIVTARRRRN